MSSVQVTGVPISCSLEELLLIFAQAGEIRHLNITLDNNRSPAEGQAPISYASSSSAAEASDLLDSYPMGASLLEVQEVGVDQYMGRLLSSLHSKSGSLPRHAAAAAAGSSGQSGTAGGAAGGSRASASGQAPLGPSALEDEMRELQLQLQQQADAGDFQQSFQASSSQEAPDDSGWQGVVSKDMVRRSQPPTQQPQQPQQPPPPPPGGSRGAAYEPEVPNTGLWIGWIDLGVERPALIAALSQYGPVIIEHLQAAHKPAYNGKMYKWGIARYRNLEDAIRARTALKKQVIPGISKVPLKVTYYQPHHGQFGKYH